MFGGYVVRIQTVVTEIMNSDGLVTSSIAALSCDLTLHNTRINVLNNL